LLKKELWGYLFEKEKKKQFLLEIGPRLPFWPNWPSQPDPLTLPAFDRPQLTPTVWRPITGIDCPGGTL
jgi:hypothetical protein